MAFNTGIQTINVLAANQAVTNSITNVDITGFTFNLEAGKQLRWQLRGIFSLGATGGFRFRANSTTTPTAILTEGVAVDLTTPATFNFGTNNPLGADFTNAAAVSSTYTLLMNGYIIANTATVFSLQFAQNNATGNAITVQRGVTLELWQF